MQPYRTRLNKLYAFSKLLKINELYQYSAMKFMFRLYNDREFKDKIPLVNEIHAYNTRQSSNNNIFISHLLACKSSNTGVGNLFRTADRFKSETFSRTGLKNKHKYSAIKFYFSSKDITTVIQ